ncbi:MAG: biotin/lipoyl-binding protein, partial [Chloroflexota bacterium]
MRKLAFILLLGSVLIAACGGAGAPATDATVVPVVADDFSVVAEGRLEPAQYASIAFAASGKVAELLVTEGQPVEADAVIARLENSEALQAEVARAEAEVVSAQQAFDDLTENHYLALAQAEADVANANKQLDTAQRKLKNLNYPDIKWYQEQVDKAQDALKTAQENVEVVDIGQLSAALQAAKDALKSAEERHGKIKAAIDGCPECDPKREVTVDFWSQTLEDA